MMMMLLLFSGSVRSNLDPFAVFDDAVQKAGGLKAGAVLGAAAKTCGGGGGGKPGFAQAGGRDVSKLDAALDDARRAIMTALAAKP